MVTGIVLVRLSAGKEKSALAKIKDIAAASKHKKPGGFHIVEPDTSQLNSKIKDGFKFMGFGSDMRFLDTACRNSLKEIQR